MRKLIRENYIIYIVDDQEYKDTLGKEIGYNLLEASVRHDILYKYFLTYEDAFENLKNETATNVIFTKPGNTFDPIWLTQLVEKNSNYSLIGHILDKGSEYYELHNQCFILNVNDWKSSGCPIYDAAVNYSCININRSTENFHDKHTPKSIEKGEGVTTYKKIKPGGLIISKLLENGFKIRPWTDEERKHKFYLYDDLVLKYGSYLRIECNFDDTIFNCTNEPIVKFELPKIKRIITPANGLQALQILDKCPNARILDFKDISQPAIEFTKKIIYEYQGKNYDQFCFSSGYNLQVSDNESIKKSEKEFLEGLIEPFSEMQFRLLDTQCNFSRESFFEIENLIQNIHDNTLYAFSNILSYRKTAYLYSQIHFNLMIKALASAERIAMNDSYFLGILPTSESKTKGYSLMSVKDINLYPDEEFNFPWRQQLYEYYTEYLRILRKKEVRATLLRPR
jgi:hypothetical protein